MWCKVTWQTNCWRCESKASKQQPTLKSNNENRFGSNVFNYNILLKGEKKCGIVGSCLHTQNGDGNYEQRVFRVVHIVCVIFLCVWFLLLLDAWGDLWLWSLLWRIDGTMYGQKCVMEKISKGANNWQKTHKWEKAHFY